MKILITGNMGYLGPVLYRQLKVDYPAAQVWGFDSGYFAHCLTGVNHLPECEIDCQIYGDMRNFPFDILDNVDTLVHLGAISNDPMGKKYEQVTKNINYLASKEIVTQAKKRGVKFLVFASSCSIYGQATESPRCEDDDLNPLTAYAKSKVAIEKEIEKLADSSFTVTALRFATACGMSPRLRLDLVLNDFVASAIALNEIVVLSDGTPWRPLIHVKDMSRAISWAIQRKSSYQKPFLVVNVGSESWNYQVKELAEAVSEQILNTKISINKNAAPDKRSYKVDFSFFRELAPNHQPLVSLHETIEELKNGLEKMNFCDPDFRKSNLVRLKMLESHISQGFLTEDLKWQFQ